MFNKIYKMIKYIIIVAIGALSYGMLSSFAKIAYGQGYNAGEITFAQAAIGAFILVILAFISNFKNKKQHNTKRWKLFIAGSSMGISAYTYYLSVEYIPASLAIVLLMQMTWLSIFAEWIFYKKKPSIIEIFSAIFIIIGSILAGNLLEMDNINYSFVGIFLGTGAALLYTVYVLFTSKLGNDVPMFEKSALMTIGSAIMILLINIKSIRTSNHLDFGLLQWGIFLAVFGTIVPPICFTWGMPKIGAGLSAILLTLELPAAVICAHVILGEKVTFSQIIGIGIILLSIIIINLVKMKNNNKIIN